MENLLQKSKCSIFHNIFKYMKFQRRRKALLWSKGLRLTVVLQSSCWEVRADCFALVFLMSCDFYHLMSFPQGAVGWSAECDCSISWSYSLTHDILRTEFSLC